MKRCTVFMFIALFAWCSGKAQEKELRKFYHHHKGYSEGVKVGVGSFPLKLATWIMPEDVMADEGVPLKQLLAKVHRVKVYAISGSMHKPVETNDIQALKRKLVEKEHFDPLMEVRDGSSIVHLLNKGNGDELGNLVMLVQDENDFVIVHVRTELKIEDVNFLIKQFAKN